MPQGRIEDRLRSVAQDAPVVPEKVIETKPVDREKTCPLLLRVFVSDNGRHHRMEEFSRTSLPGNELQIYTWMDATLKELTSLVKEVRPDARRKGTTFKFAAVYPGTMGRYRLKDIGQTVGGHKGPDDAISLASQKFQIGNFMDIAISLPRDQRQQRY
ncbi:histone deacetylase complex subunit SAP18-like [Ciona intestinalis]|uniref:Histone deacetylase complex subunit SAP18 n=1 Tax=Ciona intestinalis TaxID=7719 RepID=F6SNN8_CIOIN|nr:histone deacetylase complex subunit SAP18-like [Ciona intestinalis]|eukprot:XP_009860292.1 histone deacetylase complex subunit SAP18-like [Ciona intestinalis]